MVLVGSEPGPYTVQNYSQIQGAQSQNLFPFSKNLKFSSASLAENVFSFEGFLKMPQ